MASLVRSVAATVAILLLAAPSSASEEPDCASCHEGAPETVGQSVHGAFACTDCHAGAARMPHEAAGARADCASCHGEVVEALAASTHAGRSAPTDGAPPSCASCHGSIHAALPASDPASPVHPVRQPDTCGACHARAERARENGTAVVRPVEAYRGSVHARVLKDGRGASCASCHTAHAVRPVADPGSTVHRGHVPDTCGACHDRIAAQFETSIHGIAAAQGRAEAPVCTDCHGEHRILSPSEPDAPTFATNVPLQTCARCHSDVRLAEKYGLPTDRVPSYADSYHGLAARTGVQTVAHCASCHGVHDILPSADPRSHVHPAQLARTCGRCHPGAGTRFAIGPIHVTATGSRGSVASWVRAIYVPLILVVVGAMLLHNLLDLYGKARASRAREPAHGVRPRMNRGFRLAHGLVMISFPVLVYTGFALTYPESWWARPLLRWESSWGLRGALHRGASVLLVAALVGHLVHLAVDRQARRCIAGMLFRWHDLGELRRRLRYGLGLGPEPPAAKLGYAEKAEYWAFLWGTVLMAFTGVVLWFENLSLRWLPSWAPEAATAIHFYEAVLATLAVIVWHLYGVIFDPHVYPMDAAWLTGRSPLARARERGEGGARDAPPDRSLDG